MELNPTSPIAMHGNLYPVTEFGIKRMIERMIDLGEKELAYEDCEVRIDQDASCNDHPCIRIEVCHPVRREYFQYHLARICIDKQLQLPIRFESYDWPEDDSGQPVLKEEYTYHDLQLNVTLTDADFDRDNPEYRFAKRD